MVRGADPDPYHNVTDPQHWFLIYFPGTSVINFETLFSTLWEQCFFLFLLCKNSTGSVYVLSSYVVDLIISGPSASLIQNISTIGTGRYCYYSACLRPFNTSRCPQNILINFVIFFWHFSCKFAHLDSKLDPSYVTSYRSDYPHL